MRDFLFAYGLFLAKSLTFAVVFIIILVAIGSLLARRKQKEEGMIEIKDISEKYHNTIIAYADPSRLYPSIVKNENFSVKISLDEEFIQDKKLGHQSILDDLKNLKTEENEPFLLIVLQYTLIIKISIIANAIPNTILMANEAGK